MLAASAARRQGDVPLTASPAAATDVCAAVTAICRGICSRGLTGPLASGNVSIYDSGERVLAITPRGLPFAAVGPDDVVLVDVGAEGCHARGGDPSTELPIHLAVHRHRRGRYRAILHLHSPFAVAASCLDLDHLPVLHYYQALLGLDPTPILPYAPPGSAELADRVGAAFRAGRVSAVLLAHHGAVLAAPSEAAALDLAELLEDICRLVVLVGARSGSLPDGELEPLAAALGEYLRQSR